MYLYAATSFEKISAGVESFDNFVYNVIKAAAHDLLAYGDLLKKIETGNVNTYVVAFVIGLIVIVLIFVL